MIKGLLDDHDFFNNYISEGVTPFGVLVVGIYYTTIMSALRVLNASK